MRILSKNINLNQDSCFCYDLIKWILWFEGFYKFPMKYFDEQLFNYYLLSETSKIFIIIILMLLLSSSFHVNKKTKTVKYHKLWGFRLVKPFEGGLFTWKI